MEVQVLKCMVGRQVLYETDDRRCGNARLQKLLPDRLTDMALDPTKWIAIFGDVQEWYVEVSKITSIFLVTND